MLPRFEPLFLRSPQIRFAIAVATCFATALMTKAASSPPVLLVRDASLTPMPIALHEQNQAEILRDETIITISEQGEWREVLRYAVRVRHPGGERYTRMRVGFVDKSDEIVAADAWLLPATGKRPTAYRRKDWANIADMNSTTLYTDIRWRSHLSTTAEVGDVYGGEVTVIRRHNSGQDQLTFGGELPLRRGRLVVQVPAVGGPTFSGSRAGPSSPAFLPMAPSRLGNSPTCRQSGTNFGRRARPHPFMWRSRSSHRPARPRPFPAWKLGRISRNGTIA